MDDDLLLGNSEAPLLETPATYVEPTDSGAAAAAPAAEGEEESSNYVTFTPIKPETQLKFLQLVLQLRGLKYKKVVEAPTGTEAGAEAGASTAATVEVWDTETGPLLADALRRKVFRELTGAGIAGAAADSDVVDSCVMDHLRSFSKKLTRLDSTVVSLVEGTKGERKKVRKEKGSDDEDERRKEKKSKKKEKKLKKEKKPKRSKFVDDMAGESDDDSDY